MLKRQAKTISPATLQRMLLYAEHTRSPIRDKVIVLLSVMGVDDEGDPNEVSVPAADLEATGTPAQVRAHDDDLAVVDATDPAARVPDEQHAVLAHDAKDSLVVDGGLACLGTFPVRQSCDAAIALGRALVD